MFASLCRRYSSLFGPVLMSILTELALWCRLNVLCRPDSFRLSGLGMNERCQSAVQRQESQLARAGLLATVYAGGQRELCGQSRSCKKLGTKF